MIGDDTGDSAAGGWIRQLRLTDGGLGTTLKIYCLGIGDDIELSGSGVETTLET